MLNQRLVAALLAVTTVMSSIAVNVSASYGNNSMNVQYLDQGKNLKNINWRSVGQEAKDVASAIKFAIDNRQFVGDVQKLLGWLNSFNRAKNNQDTNDLKNVLNSIDISKFSDEITRQKIQRLRDKL